MTTHPRRGAPGKITEALLRLDNDGPRVRATNYWATQHAARGYCYLSINDGALRLLFPPAIARYLPDLAQARCAAVQIIGAPRVGVIHVVWEHDTGVPPYLTLDARQCDRALPREDLGRWVTLIAYVPGDAGPESVRVLGEWPVLLREAGEAVSTERVPAGPH